MSSSKESLHSQTRQRSCSPNARAPAKDQETEASEIREPSQLSQDAQPEPNSSFSTQIEPRIAESIRAPSNEEPGESDIHELSQPSHDAESNCSTTQIEPRVEEFIQERANEQETGPAENSEPSHVAQSESDGSTTQIEPRVAEFITQLANEEPNTPAEDITISLTKAAPAAPDARLLLHSDYPDGHNMRSHPAITHLPEIIPGREIFAAAQRRHDVYFTVNFSTPIEFNCQVVYDPGSDDCLFLNQSLEEVQLSKINPPYSLFEVKRNTGQPVQPGIWRVAANRGLEHYPLLEFLLLRRSFNVSIHEANIPLAKRAPVSDTEKSSKRQKLENETPAEIIATQSTDSLTLKSGPTDTDTGSPRDIVNKAAVPLLDLADREIAVIKAPHAPVSGTYRLERIKKLGATGSTVVFSCRHSGKPRQRLVAKVLRYNGNSPLHLPIFAKLWHTEKSMLADVKHRSIVALEAFDGRMFTLYLELLPLSLYRGMYSPFTQSDAHTILLNISSALSYLANRNIVHNDIKPANIAYSPQRGAVLFDFGMACKIDERAGGGTPWYIPPDILSNKARGFAGDIWAMGVTMLYVLQKIKIPEKIARGWDLRVLSSDAPEGSSARGQMLDWVDFIAVKRAELNQKDIVENAVFQMLAKKMELRAVAADIEKALKVPLEAC